MNAELFLALRVFLVTEQGEKLAQPWMRDEISVDTQ